MTTPVQTVPNPPALQAEPAGAAAARCCEPVEQASCCAPADKTACCGDAAFGSCGCK